MRLRDESAIRRPIKSGFSLFELLIVLAVLVAVSAMAAPNLMDRIRRGKVQDASESVREVLADARRFAIDSGIDYHFRFEVSGQAVVAVPADPTPVLTNNYSSTPGDTRMVVEALILDEEFLLQAMKGVNPGGEQLEAAAFHTLAEAGDLSGRSWSTPILFRSDGTAEDRTFRVMDQDGREAQLSVRGLTGAVSVTPVFQMQDE